MAAILHQPKCVKQDCNDYTQISYISYAYRIPHHLGYVHITALYLNHIHIISPFPLNIALSPAYTLWVSISLHSDLCIYGGYQYHCTLSCVYMVDINITALCLVYIWWISISLHSVLCIYGGYQYHCTQTCVYMVDINITAPCLVYICISTLIAVILVLLQSYQGPLWCWRKTSSSWGFVCLYKHMITCNKLGMYLPLFTIPYIYTGKQCECLTFWQNAN